MTTPIRNLHITNKTIWGNYYKGNIGNLLVSWIESSDGIALCLLSAQICCYGGSLEEQVEGLQQVFWKCKPTLHQHPQTARQVVRKGWEKSSSVFRCSFRKGLPDSYRKRLANKYLAQLRKQASTNQKHRKPDSRILLAKTRQISATCATHLSLKSHQIKVSIPFFMPFPKEVVVISFRTRNQLHHIC